MTIKLPRFIATSVVRSSQQGESHGGIYTVDFENQSGELHVDWNTSDIDFEGRGADRGLRGIAFDGWLTTKWYAVFRSFSLSPAKGLPIPWPSNVQVSAPSRMPPISFGSVLSCWSAQFGLSSGPM